MYKLLIFAKSIKDFRLDRKKLHSVENIVFITIVALLCGAQDWEDIEDFGEIRKGFFSRFLDLKNGIPSHDTFNRFFSLYDPKKFQNLFVIWINEVLTQNKHGNHIAIDGKSLRGTAHTGGSMVHLLHAFLIENNCLIGQEKTADKSNEITAIPILLDALDLKDALVSIDAMGCQIEIAEKIIDQKGDYFLAVKDNQKNLHTDIQTAFKVFKANPREENIFTAEEINGSKVEKRTAKVMSDLSHLEHPEVWKGLRSIIKIESEIYHKTSGKTTNDTRYYITSKLANASEHLKYSRNHWKIENNLHWALDVVFNEDQMRKRRNNVAENFSIIQKLVLKILQEKKPLDKGVSLRRMRKKAGWSDDYILWLLDF